MGNTGFVNWNVQPICEGFIMIDLSASQMAELKYQEGRWLNDKAVQEFYRDDPHKHVGYGVSMRHTASQQFKRPHEGLDVGTCFGVELEFELEYTSFVGKNEVGKSISAGIRHQLFKMGLAPLGFSVQEDGSLSNGLEVVLPPLPVYRLKQVLRKIYNKHGLQWLAKESEHTGLHVTVDWLPEPQAVHFWNFWQMPIVYDAFRDIINRDPNHFCGLTSYVSSYSEMRQSPRKSSVYLRDNKSMEVRVFKGSIDVNVAIQQIMLVKRAYMLAERGLTDLQIFQSLKKYYKVDDL